MKREFLRIAVDSPRLMYETGVIERMDRLRQGMIVAGMVLMAAVGAEAQGGGPASVAEQYLFAAVNNERVAQGLQPLHWDDALYQAADGHAREMAERRSISHQYPGEPALGERGRAAGARFSAIAENVAEAPSAVRIHDAWMHSPGHRANILNGRLTAVAIRVLSRDGELYAVEDFDRSVERLSIAQQEAAVGELVRAAGAVDVIPANDDAHRTCEMDTGYSGKRQPYFVMRFTAGDLDHLPSQLTERLASGRFHEAMVGACASRGGESFTAFNVAVLLYP